MTDCATDSRETGSCRGAPETCGGACVPRRNRPETSVLASWRSPPTQRAQTRCANSLRKLAAHKLAAQMAAQVARPGLLANLLGHEGQGSLLAALRQAGWADGLSAGSAQGDGDDALFVVDAAGAQYYERDTKAALAERLIAQIAERLADKTGQRA